MEIYLKLLSEHDKVKQISIIKKATTSFFEVYQDKAEINIQGKTSGERGVGVFHLKTDPRIGGDIKSILEYEGNYTEGDLLIFYKQKNKQFLLEIIRTTDSRYSFYKDIINNDNHLLLYGDNLQENDKRKPILLTVNEPHQQIYFGAPGTGKSYKLNQKAKQLFPHTHSRVTFHPNYLYANFVGTYKPFPKREEGKEDRIIYKFIPGPLIITLTKAIAHPETPFLLIIEEINRSDVTAVFGDVFQLLDRKNGESEYKIGMSEDLRDFFETVIKEESIQGEPLDEDSIKNLQEFLSSHEIYFPNNFYIWATMNSADQGVKPMDTAFKRRWALEYVGINDGVTHEFNNYYFRFRTVAADTADKAELVKWNEFREKVNERLAELNVPEDKLIGPYFISKSVLESGIDSLTEAVKNKVLIYLFDDAAKPYRHKFFSEESNCRNLYSAVCNQFIKDGEKIFSRPLGINFYSMINVVQKDINSSQDNVHIESDTLI